MKPKSRWEEGGILGKERKNERRMEGRKNVKGIS
jgi:hypothetical protein